MSRTLPQDDPTMVRGWEAIARQLRVGSSTTAMTYARRNIDPLPVVVVRGTPSAIPQYVDEWWARSLNSGVARDGTPLERVTSIDAIRELLDVSKWTVFRMTARADDPLPLRWSAAGARWAYVTALRDWVDRQTIPFRVHDRLATIPTQ